MTKKKHCKCYIFLNEENNCSQDEYLVRSPITVIWEDVGKPWPRNHRKPIQLLNLAHCYWRNGTTSWLVMVIASLTKHRWLAVRHAFFFRSDWVRIGKNRFLLNGSNSAMNLDEEMCFCCDSKNPREATEQFSLCIRNSTFDGLFYC